MNLETLLSKASQELQALVDRIEREGYPTYDNDIPLIQAGLVKYNNYVRTMSESSKSLTHLKVLKEL